MADLTRAELELAIYAKVYELLLSHPIRSAFREADDGPEGEPPATDPEMLVAVQADRFDLMTGLRELRRAAQQELFDTAANDGVSVPDQQTTGNAAPTAPKGTP